MALEIRPADLDNPQLCALVAAHHAHAQAETPPENIYALDLSELSDVHLITVWDGPELLGMGGLRAFGTTDGEIKSVHVAEAARGRGVARRVMTALEQAAEDRDMAQLWLETGATPGYRGSRALYAACGFTPCGPFGDYPDHPNSVFMTKRLKPEGSAHEDRALAGEHLRV